MTEHLPSTILHGTRPKRQDTRALRLAKRLWQRLRRLAIWLWFWPEGAAMRRLGVRVVCTTGDAILLEIHGQPMWTTRQAIARGVVYASWYQNSTLRRAYTGILRHARDDGTTDH